IRPRWPAGGAGGREEPQQPDLPALRARDPARRRAGAGERAASRHEPRALLAAPSRGSHRPAQGAGPRHRGVRRRHRPAPSRDDALRRGRLPRRARPGAGPVRCRGRPCRRGPAGNPVRRRGFRQPRSRGARPRDARPSRPSRAGPVDRHHLPRRGAASPGRRRHRGGGRGGRQPDPRTGPAGGGHDVMSGGGAALRPRSVSTGPLPLPRSKMIRSVSTLLVGMSILLAGSGLLGTALGLRAAFEQFAEARTGIIMAGYFVGFVGGYWICPPIIRRVGFVRAFAAFASMTAAAAIAYSLYVQPIPWFALRIVNGIGLVGIYMTIESWLGAHAGAARGRVLAAYMTMNMLGLAAGQALVDLYPIEGVEPFAIAAGLFCIGLVPIALTPVMEPARVESASVR